MYFSERIVFVSGQFECQYTLGQQPIVQTPGCQGFRRRNPATRKGQVTFQAKPFFGIFGGCAGVVKFFSRVIPACSIGTGVANAKSQPLAGQSHQGDERKEKTVNQKGALAKIEKVLFCINSMIFPATPWRLFYGHNTENNHSHRSTRQLDKVANCSRTVHQ